MKSKMLVIIIGVFLLWSNAFAVGDLIVTGKVGVGTPTPSALLDVNSGIIRALGNTDAGAPSTGKGLEMSYSIPLAGGRILAYDRTNSAYKGLFIGISNGSQLALWSNGKVSIGTLTPTHDFEVNFSDVYKYGGGVWGQTSDQRVKTNIQPYKKGLDQVLQINPVTYNYNGKGGIGHKIVDTKDPVTGELVPTDVPDTDLLSKTFVGIIAQDIQPVLPETVSFHKGKINKDDSAQTDILDFDGSALIYVLINSVKELKAEIDSLNQQVADLKGKVK